MTTQTWLGCSIIHMTDGSYTELVYDYFDNASFGMGFQWNCLLSSDMLQYSVVLLQRAEDH